MASWEDQLNANYERNKGYATPGAYQTELPPEQEQQFQKWLITNKVPFDPSQSVQDYDMRGFFSALLKGDPRAKNAIDPYDHRLHFPDVWKTPYHETFSNESIYAGKGAPSWDKKDRLVAPDGTVVFDPRRAK